MTQLSVPRASLLALPLEIRNMIYRYVYHNEPYRSGYLNFLLTCRQISSEAHLIAFSATTFRLGEWRDEQLSTRLSFLKPQTIAAITSLEIEVESWNGDLDAFEPGTQLDEYVAWLKRDEELWFWDIYNAGEWLIKILGLFEGLEELTLFSDGHGYIWEWKDIKSEFELLEKGEGEVWSIVDSDETEEMLTLSLTSKEDDSEGNLRERTVVIWVE